MYKLVCTICVGKLLACVTNGPKCEEVRQENIITGDVQIVDSASCVSCEYKKNLRQECSENLFHYITYVVVINPYVGIARQIHVGIHYVGS